METVHRYPAALRAIHWVTVALIVIVYGITYAEGLFERGTAARAMVWSLHISFGLLLIAFVAARLLVRATVPMPPPSTALSPLIHMASKAAHVLLYVLLIVTPLVGVYLAFLRGNEVSLFGLFTLPSPVAVDRTFGRQVQEVHEWLANALVLIALVHALAALWHHFIRRDDVLRRMLPGH